MRCLKKPRKIRVGTALGESATSTDVPSRRQDGFQDGFKTTRRRQDEKKTVSRRYDDDLKSFKRAEDRNLTPTWPNLGPSWTPSGRPNPVKTNGFCMFLLLHRFASQDAQDDPKTAPRAPQEASRRPREVPKGPERPQDGPQDDPKTAPRRLQGASKTHSKTTLC